MIITRLKRRLLFIFLSNAELMIYISQIKFNKDRDFNYIVQSFTD